MSERMQEQANKKVTELEREVEEHKISLCKYDK